jgi:HEAT repeat protein
VLLHGHSLPTIADTGRQEAEIVPSSAPAREQTERVLTIEERGRVQQAVREFGFLGRGDLDALRAREEPDLPYELLARAVVEATTPKLRWQAIDLLDHYADHRFDHALVAALHDPVARVRRHAAHALGCDACSRLPNPVDPVPPLIEAVLGDDNVKVRRQAFWGLVSHRVDERVRVALALVAVQDDDERLRRDADAVVTHFA